MRSQMDKNKKDEMEVLFPEKEICGYVIKPWTLRMAKNLYPVLLQIATQCKEHGITLDKLSTTLPGKLDILFGIAFMHGEKIIAETTGMTEEDAGNLEAEVSIKLLQEIFYQNLDALKNSFGLASVSNAM